MRLLKSFLIGLVFLGASSVTAWNCVAANDRNITYDRDIATIMREHCVGCHRPGQSGPFSLLSRSDVVRQAATIGAVVEDGYMPPWKPVPTGIKFANDRRLTPEEKDLIEQWVSQLTSPEYQAELVDSPVKPLDCVNECSAWSLGPPDLVVRMREPFAVPAEGPDIYRSFVLPVGLPDDRWIKAMELHSMARGTVHHALFFVDPDGTARTRSKRDGQTGFSGMSFLSPSGSGFDAIAKNMNRGLGGYVPGAIPNRLPGDLARKLPAGSDIVMQTHFHPVGREVNEQAELGLYFAKQPPSQRIVPIQVPALFGIGAGIDIPAGNENYLVADTYKLPIDVEAIEIGGHAHYLCKSMHMTAIQPDGKQLDLLRIDSWDLDWQDQYQFKNRIPLPKGTTLRVQIRYDNSDSNPSNPFTPPRRVQWGRESNDEMGSIVLHVVARTEADREVLEQDIERFTLASIRRRIDSRTKSFSRLTGLKPGVNLLLTLFDRNDDGALQGEEIPVSHRNNLLDFFDLDADQTLSSAELKRARELYAKLMQSDDDS